MKDHECESSECGHAADPVYMMRHSLAHVMAQAVKQLRPEAKLAFGPPVEHGFYYDFDLKTPLTPEDLPVIEKRMREIIKAKQPFEQKLLSLSEAVENLKKEGETYKVEYAEELAGRGEEKLSFYRNGPFEDMCGGPHVKDTGELPPDGFKVDSIAGAYWRGDEKRTMLTRIYAVAFPTKAELDDFLQRRELAKERDHRKLGAELEIYTISDKIGPGLVLWLPNGTVIREELEKFAKEIEFRAGYERVATPHIAKESLYYTSGHLPYYKDTMFPPMELKGEEPYYLKAMNCPHHHIIYKARPRSYRELPLRLAEYGTCYRYEDSGTLAGLLRVRAMAMNDSHIYCTADQIAEEFRGVLAMHEFYYKKFRFKDYGIRLSLHDPAKKEKYIDQPEAWERSEDAVRRILREMGVPFVEAGGEAAFYGPKVDFQMRNLIGREETASTCQLDFAAAERFDLTYIAEDGKEHRPFVIHRAPLSTHERMIAFLIENFGGAFPTWMSPVQVQIIPVGEKFTEYAKRIEKELFDKLIRVHVDSTAESMNKRLRNAITKKIPNILIVGEREASSESVTWRRYAVTEQKSIKLSEFVAAIEKMIAERTMDNFPDEG